MNESPALLVESMTLYSGWFRNACATFGAGCPFAILPSSLSAARAAQQFNLDLIALLLQLQILDNTCLLL